MRDGSNRPGSQPLKTLITTHPLTRFACLIALALSGLPWIMNADPSPAKTLCDFTTTNASAAWQIVNDDVMGGVSTSRFELPTNGPAVFRGVLSLENNGGFASARSATLDQDLAGLKSFILRARGDGRRYKLTARTAPGFDTAVYQSEFTTKSNVWEEYRLPFQNFRPTFRGRVLPNLPPLDPAKLLAIGVIIADQQAGPFRLEIAWVKAEGAPAARQE